MNKKLIVLIILVFIILIFSLYPKFNELNIKQQIEKANYCDANSDCINLGQKCPFGCCIYVNVNEVDKLSNLLLAYNSKCVYGCLSCEKVICENKKCKEII